MSDDPLIAIQQPLTIDTNAPEVERAVPSAEQQATADDVFTDGQGQVIAALMAVQTGVGLMHLIADNARTGQEEKPRVPPRDLPKE